MYFSKDADFVPTFESPWIHRGWTPAAECRRIDAFELWCWIRPLSVRWTARRSNQSTLKEMNPEYSLEGLMLHLQYLAAGVQPRWIQGDSKVGGRRWRLWKNTYLITDI